MDSTGSSLPIERELQSNDSMSEHRTPASTDASAFSDETNSQQLHDDSISPSSLDSPVQCLVEDNIAFMGAKCKHVQYDCRRVLTDEAEIRSLDSHNVVGVDGSQAFGKQGLHIVSVSPGTGNLSQLSSEGGYESPESMTPCPNIVCSECEPDDVRKTTIEELDKDLMGTSDVQDGSSSKNDSDAHGEKSKAPAIVSWKGPAVDKSEIPPDVHRPSKSDITDLGDREFYANLNATGRKSTASFPLDNNQEHLALQDQFFETLVRIHEERKGFFPRALLSTLVTEDCVFNELTRCLNDTHNPSQIQAYAKKICAESPLSKAEDDSRPPKIRSFKKIFVILVLIEKTCSISKFLEEDVNDLDLPLVKFQKGKNGSRFDLRLPRSQNKALECFRNWTQFYIKAFEEWQWTTLSPFFHKGTRKDVQHFRLQDSVILPFTADSRRDIESEFRMEVEGGYGRVFKVDIHQDHHNFDLPTQPNRSFAIKRLNSQNKEDFKKEVEMLKMFSDDAHRHLISLLATYEQFRVYSLIFPCADGDLTRFWSVLKPKPSFDLKTVRWVAEQCEGIAHGLVNIHKYQTSNSKATAGPPEKRYGRHGDLKPENILWFSDADGGTLKISDFGLAEYSTTHSRSYKPKSRVATSMSYRPPECDLKGGVIGPSYDVWTLGCLYLEFITWLLGGWKLVKTFEEKRMSFDPMWCDMYTDTFFELVECPKSWRPAVVAARVKPAVKDFMQELHAHQSCTEFLHNFINMVQLDMLIVKSNNPMEKGRIASEEVHVKLAGMLKRCEDADYACKPAPWPKMSNISWTSDEVVEVDITDHTNKVLLWKKFRPYEGPIQEIIQPRTLAVPKHDIGQLSLI